MNNNAPQIITIPIAGGSKGKVEIRVWRDGDVMMKATSPAEVPKQPIVLMDEGKAAMFRDDDGTLIEVNFFRDNS